MFFIYALLLVCSLALYVCTRLIFTLKVRVPFKILLSLIVFFSFNQLMLTRFLQRTMGFELSEFAIMCSTWLLVTVILCAIILIIYDLLCIIFRKSKIKIFNPNTRAISFFAVSMLLAVLSISNALQVPSVKEIELKVEDMPGLNGLKIAVLADLHIGTFYDEEWIKEVVKRTNEAKPDVIALAGDVIDSSVYESAHIAEELGQLKAKYGTYLALGNHEYYRGLDSWVEEFKKTGLNVLINSHKEIKIGSDTLVIGGTADLASLSFNTAGLLNNQTHDIEKTFEGSPNSFRFLIDHQPKVAENNSKHEVDLQVSGHTHGGLIPVLQPIIAMFNDGFVSGHYKVNEMDLIVSNGAGLWAGLPMRLFVPNEIVIIKLSSI